MAPVILVDAANVVGSRPDGWWRDRAGAAARLVADLVSADLGPCTVVLEGAARAGVPVGTIQRCGVGPGRVAPAAHQGSPATETTLPLRVMHASGSGDDTLAALCGPGVTLVTADRGLRARGESVGASCRGPRWLLDQLPPTPPS